MPYQSNYLLEICTDSSEIISWLTKIPVARIELCAALSEGGLTPPVSLMEKVCKESPIPVHVMIRPRSGDFLYSDDEFELMKSDIRHAIKSGAAGVVFG